MLFGGFIYDFGAWRADKRIGAAIAADGAKAAVTTGGGRTDSASTGAHIDGVMVAAMTHGAIIADAEHCIASVAGAVSCVPAGGNVASSAVSTGAGVHAILAHRMCMHAPFGLTFGVSHERSSW